MLNSSSKTNFYIAAGRLLKVKFWYVKLWAPSLEKQQRFNPSCLKYFTRNAITCISLYTAYVPLSAILLALMYCHLVRTQPACFYSSKRNISGLMCSYQIVKVLWAKYTVWHLSLKICLSRYQLRLKAVKWDKNCFPVFCILKCKCKLLTRTSDTKYGLRLYSQMVLDFTGYIFRIASYLLQWF